MSYKRIKFEIKDETLVLYYLTKILKMNMNKVQKYISKGRIIVNGEVITKPNIRIKGILEIVDFVSNSNGLKPIFETTDLCFFDKPSGVVVHPINRQTDYSLLDDIYEYLGNNGGFLGHRIDKETSGLVLVSKSKKIDKQIKQMFENRQIHKEYIALVNGKINDEIDIEKNLSINTNYDTNKHKMLIDDNGLYAKTKIIPLYYNKTTNTTLIKAIPYTGRTHQIRIHLNYINHPIIGDPLYGVDFEIAQKHLNNDLNQEERLFYTKSNRVCLHSHRLVFTLNNHHYNIKSDIIF